MVLKKGFLFNFSTGLSLGTKALSIILFILSSSFLLGCSFSILPILNLGAKGAGFLAAGSFSGGFLNSNFGLAAGSSF